MQPRILDLDGSLVRQPLLLRHSGASIFWLQDWGRKLRIACRHRSFAHFQERLARLANSPYDAQPFLNFLGSGDFHHVSLALLRRLTCPFNLLVIDNHPDWMRGLPFLHCGTWLFHAAGLPGVQRIFHVGGDVDFDNVYRWLAPWRMIHSGKIVVAPAQRRFQGRCWDPIAHQPLRRHPDEPAGKEQIEKWLAPYQKELATFPLYISLDKDVLNSAEAVVNWDSGHLTPAEMLTILETFVNAADGELAGMDVVGDWSPVHLNGWMRRFLHWIEHPNLKIDAGVAVRRNEELNLRLLECLASLGMLEPKFRLETLRGSVVSPNASAKRR